MRLTLVILLLAAVGPSLTQFGNIALSSVPQCAQNCLASNIEASGGCSNNDYGCFCKSSGFINAVSCCLQNTCNSTEQKTAITFNVALCNSYNVSIPNYLGCSYLQSVSYNASSVSFPSTILVTALASITTVDSYIPAYVTTRGGPVASFSGPPILTGSCTAPLFASFTPSDGIVTQFPYVGCQNSGCCPFKPGDPGPLTVCPHDYFTTSGACCPSGWSLATKTLAGGLTYCATEPAELIVPATTAQGGHAAVISDMLFTLKYDLGEASPTSLSAGAIAGVAVGCVLGVLAGGLAGLLLYRARQRRAQKIRNATVPTPAPADHEHEEFSPTTKESPGQFYGGGGSVAEHVVEAPAAAEIPSELPSPPPLLSPVKDGYYSAPQSAVAGIAGFGGIASPLVVESRPQELPGSTHIHEHHPAMIAQEGDADTDMDTEGDSYFDEEPEEEKRSQIVDSLEKELPGKDTKQQSNFGPERVSSLFDSTQSSDRRDELGSIETSEGREPNNSRGVSGLYDGEGAFNGIGQAR